MRESYRIAGIDVHKRMLAVVVADAAAEGNGSSNGANSEPQIAACRNYRSG